MRSHTAPVPLKAGLLLLLSTWSHVASALNPDICSSFNTGGQEPADDTPKMSNGYCVDTCKSEYAYAITQGEKCWCSNYAPAEDVTVSLGQCNQGCPSYPLEPCGGSGVFSFMRLGNPVSGTKGAVSSPSPKPTSTTDTSKSTPTTSMIQTVTVDGKVTTVTVAPTAASPSETETGSSGNGGDKSGSNSGASSGSGGGLKTGAIVGIVIGIVALVLIAVGIFLFWFLRRRKQSQDDDFQDDPSVRGSSSGMMGSNRPEMSHSGGSPGSPGSAGNRNSMLQIDPRMDPFKQTMYGRNGSTESVNTLRDDHDYSRRIQQPKVLRATNPDPE